MRLDFLHPREREDVSIDLEAISLVFNHRLRIAILYDRDPGMPADRYDALEKHLNRRGYILQVIVAPATAIAERRR